MRAEATRERYDVDEPVLSSGIEPLGGFSRAATDSTLRVPLLTQFLVLLQRLLLTHPKAFRLLGLQLVGVRSRHDGVSRFRWMEMFVPLEDWCFLLLTSNWLSCVNRRSKR